MDVQGLQPRWPVGEHRQSSVALKAEQYCLGCHVKAAVGDVLGTVIVRSYLDRKEAAWWDEVRVAAGALSVKILIHTVVLFLLLKVRMAPLLALRSTVAGLAKGVMDLSPRAAVATEDEFGELARDLNHFLDRIAVVVADLDKILTEVVTVGNRLGTLNRTLETQLDGMRDTALRSLGHGAQRGLDTQLAVARESGAFGVLAQTLDDLAATGAAVPAGTELLRGQVARLRASFDAVTQALGNAAPPVLVSQAQSGEFQAFAQSLREMAVLEATMQSVAESGQQLLRRLQADRQRQAGEPVRPQDRG
jgi:methyl-accepting chemotaxis protein